jgi:hypothetical protein
MTGAAAAGVDQRLAASRRESAALLRSGERRAGLGDLMSRSASVTLVLAVAASLGATPVSAGPCAAKIAQFRASLGQAPGGETAVVGSAPQSIDAQLEHQPTPASVERAKENAKAQIVAVLARAESLDAQGRQHECRQALRKARLLLNP